MEPKSGGDVFVPWQEASGANRELWEDRAPLHENLYDAHTLAQDPDRISPVVRDDLPVLMQHLGHPKDPDRPLADLDLLHLQCHIGTDTLSLARLGAKVTGLDFSPASLEVAARLANEAGLDITWVEADALQARSAVTGEVDVV